MVRLKGLDLRCGAGHLGLKRATGTFPSALGFKSIYHKKATRTAKRPSLLLWCA